MKIEFSAKDISKLYEEHAAIEETLTNYNCTSGTAYATSLGIKVEAFGGAYGQRLSTELKENLLKDFELKIRNALATRRAEIENTFKNLGLNLV